MCGRALARSGGILTDGDIIRDCKTAAKLARVQAANCVFTGRANRNTASVASDAVSSLARLTNREIAETRLTDCMQHCHSREADSRPEKSEIRVSLNTKIFYRVQKSQPAEWSGFRVKILCVFLVSAHRSLVYFIVLITSGPLHLLIGVCPLIF